MSSVKKGGVNGTLGINDQSIPVKFLHLDRFSWKPSTGDPYVKLFLRKMEHEVFFFLSRKPQSCNLNKEEWQASKNLKEDRSIII